MLLYLGHCGHQQYCSSKYKTTTRKEYSICLNFYICKHLHFSHITINDMAQKDPVCNMMVDEKNAQHISEANGQKIYLCSAQCKNQFDQNPSKYGY